MNYNKINVSFRYIFREIFHLGLKNFLKKVIHKIYNRFKEMNQNK